MTEASLLTRTLERSYAALAALTPFTAWRHFSEMQANQWKRADELRTLQWTKLRRLLDHAATAVPFYRDAWAAAGVDPRGFSSIADLRCLPLTTRAALTEGRRADAFLLSRRNDYEMTHSSGTTGARVYLPYTRADMQVKYAAYLREFYATGWRLGVPSAALHYSGHPEFGGRYMDAPDRDNYVAFREIVFRVFHRRTLLTPYSHAESGSETVVEGWYDALRRQRPFLLETMDFNILALLEYIESRGLPRLRIPRMIVLATLSPALRARLQKAFDTEVFNRFGPHEMEGVAYECPSHVGLHIALDSVCVEILDSHDQPVPPGEPGRLVLTDLDSYVMPLIRYDIGDIGRLIDRPCSCGRGFPLMTDIVCRQRDLLDTPDGGRLHPRELIALLQDERAVRYFQLVQLRPGSIEARVVPDRDLWQDEDVVSLQRRTTAVAPEMTVRVVPVTSVPLERNGKFSFVRKTT